MIVTINTDASFHYDYKVGAYAFWIVSNLGKVLHCGALKEKALNPTDAETKCIINAISTLRKQNWTGIEKVIINTDSLNSIYILENRKPEIKKYRLNYGDNLRADYNKIKSSFLPPIEFRHVKAHKTIETARSWVNDWCDKKAKEMLWKEINLNHKK